MSEVIISPSILSSDFANLGRDIRFMEKSGADWIHIDVMDGHFVPNITIGAPVVKSIRKVTKMPFDVHLMIENPKNYIKDFIEAGADIVTFHYEAVQRSEIIEMAKYIKGLGVKAGLSIKPKTNPEEILEYLPYFDLLLVMTVEPGFGGQKFMRECAEKIDLIKRFADESMIIQVDGGINSETARVCTELGANSLVAGSYIFNSEDYENAIKSLR
ncbi:ribulose-phosphate 3-epimerase [Candidatus Gastranaerophilales bacterium]|nr:MAG: ribulose-phosphate 3-epimerase [Candidatus Gastranaerophilales bacterium]